MLTTTEPKTAIPNLFSKLSLQPHNEIFQNWVSCVGKSAFTKMRNVSKFFLALLTMADLKTSRAKCLFSVVCYHKQTSEMNVFGTDYLNKHFRNEYFFCMIITTAKQNTSEVCVLYSVHNNTASNFNPKCVILLLCSHTKENFRSVFRSVFRA